MLKEGIRGLRPSYKQDKQSALRTSVGGAQAAIEFKIFELEQTHYTIFHVNVSMSTFSFAANLSRKCR